jgi:dihydrofolate reductase
MRKVIVSEFISLDNVIESPEKWHFPYISDDFNEHNVKAILEAAAFLYGSNTYQAFASFWPSMTNNEYGIADKLNNAPKYVVSKSMNDATWNNSTILSGDLTEEIKSIKQQGNGIIAMTGSGTLIHSMMQANLIDQFDLLLHPIVVGSGQRLFTDGMSSYPLKLVETQTFNSGVILLRYQPAS